MTVTLQVLYDAVAEAGLAERPVCVHSSLRSFGWVEGGASSVIQALLGHGCTVVVPTHAYQHYAVPPPDRAPASPAIPIYTPASNLVDAENMGAIPVAALAMPGRVRGQHSLDSFTAVGAEAHALIDGQTPQDVYAPVRTLARMGGWLVLMGVGLNRLTALHHAEKMAGRPLFTHWAKGREGTPIPNAIGGCSEGFVNLDATLAPIERRVRVGRSLWRIFPAAEALRLAAQAIVHKPGLTHCGDPKCGECNTNVETTGERALPYDAV